MIASSIRIKTYDPARFLIVGLAEPAVQQQFARQRTLIVIQRRDPTAIGTGGTFFRTRIVTVGFIQGAVQIQPGNLSHFDAIDDNCIACFQSIGFVILPGYVIPEATGDEQFILLSVDFTNPSAMKSAVKSGKQLRRILLLRSPPWLDTHCANV